MKNYLRLLLAAIILIPISAIIRNPHEPVWYSQYLSLLLFLFIGLGLFFRRFDRFLSYFFLVCVFSTFFVTRASPRAFVLLTNLGLGILCSYGISKFKQSDRKKINIAILAIVVFQFILVALQFFNLDPIFHSLIRQGYDETVGFSGSRDFIGTFFALTLPVSLYFSPLLASINIIGMMLSKSSFAFVAGISAGIFYLLFNKRIIGVFFLIMAVALSVLYFVSIDRLKSADFSTRISVWRYSVMSVVNGKMMIESPTGIRQIILCNPLIGYGFGNFLRLMPFVPQAETKNKFNYANEKFTHAHNDYIEAFFELGYIGLVAMLLFFVALIIDFMLLMKTKEMVLYFSCLLVAMLNCIGNFLFQNPVSGFLILLFYGLYKGSLDGENSVVA